MKKRVNIVAACLLILVCALGLAACGDGGGGTEHTHTLVCHEAVEADCAQNGNIEYWSCTDCDKYYSDEQGTEISDKASVIIWATGNHTLGEWSKDASEHWHECSVCEQKVDVEEHIWDDGTVKTEPTCGTDGEKTLTCTVCGQTKTEIIPATGHSFSNNWSKDADYHWHDATCGHTDQTGDKAAHTYDTGVVTQPPTCTEEGVKAFTCTVCGQVKTEKLGTIEHSGLSDWQSDEVSHWKNCSVCHQRCEAASHQFDADNHCTICGYIAYTKGLEYRQPSPWIKEYEVTGIGTATAKEILIPSKYNGFPVTSIGESAFDQCVSLTNITIPDSVRSIGNLAFYKCSRLTNVTIPDSVRSIGDLAFYNCSSLMSVTIPDRVSIGNSAFYNCSSLMSVTIPDRVSSIGSSAFYGTAWYNNQPNGLIYAGKVAYKYKGTMPANTKITIKDGTLGIAASAFESCSGLTSVTIPNSVTSIGASAFESCSGLTSITIPFVGADRNSASNTHFGYIFGAGSYNENSKYVPSSLKTVVITGGTSIGSYAFRSCHWLMSISIPNSVTSIGIAAFWDCDGLTSITIPFVGADKDKVSNTHFGYIFGAASYNDNAYDVPSSLKTVVITGVTRIGSNAFSGCSGLTSVTIQKSVTRIGNDAFNECSGLTSVTIPDNVTGIDYHAFYDCYSLTSIVFNGTIAQWQAINKESEWNSSTGNYTITCSDGKLDKNGHVISE